MSISSEEIDLSVSIKGLSLPIPIVPGIFIVVALSWIDGSLLIVEHSLGISLVVISRIVGEVRLSIVQRPLDEWFLIEVGLCTSSHEGALTCPP